MTRLRTVFPHQRGIRRQRRGRGFAYVDVTGEPVTDPVVLERIKGLVIPPAWRDVWICPYPNGHIQAVGTDDAGRRQYLYHPVWREQRDREKFERILSVGQNLPAARRRAAEAAELPGMPRERALATAFRLLDLGFFRVGGESYTAANGSYGLATLLRRHARIERGAVVFDYIAKSGQPRTIRLEDPVTAASVRALLRRRGGGDELLAFQEGRRWRDVTSTDINAYVKEVLRCDVSAKDFRTWHATVLAAVELALAAEQAKTAAARSRAVRAAVKNVSSYLGNTPTVARASYIDPRVIELFEDGVTITVPARTVRALAERNGDRPPTVQTSIERALLRMLKADA
jgi:DNA topoisomerase IB